MNLRLQDLNQTDAAPRISIAMATYNGEKFIRQQLESIAQQTFLPVEIVVTDDGSTDKTLEIVEDFSRSAPFPVRAFRNETRLGYADNFLKAASLCVGDVIAFCDQDDIWLENKLSTCSKYFSDHNVTLVVHSAHTITQEENRQHKFPNFSRTKTLDAGDCDPFVCPPGFATLIRKELLQLTDNSDRPWRVLIHDQWSWFLATSVGRIVTVADSLALYRQHSANVFGAPEPDASRWNPKRSATARDYISMAESELACSRILMAAAKQKPKWAKRLKDSAKRLEYRSKLHQLRSRIYSQDSTLLNRAATFARIALMGGYLPDRSKVHLGIESAIKDLILGIPGLHNRHTPETGSASDA